MKSQQWLLVFLLMLCGDSDQKEGDDVVQCYSHFLSSTAECEGLLGNASEDDCCSNTQYGFRDPAGGCRACGPRSWSSWSGWGGCSVACGVGVTRRTRKCFGRGIETCPGPQNHLETKPCRAPDCCPVQGGWAPWGAWQACSVSCGPPGTRRRERLCSEPVPQCGGACSGHKHQTEPCTSDRACPVHGGWSSWGCWGECSASCKVQGLATPTRTRFRTCTSPAPSSDTLPPGDTCLGDSAHTGDCDHLPLCPVDGNWSPWPAFGPCTVTCGLGQKLSIRECSNPTPQHGGKPCPGSNTQSALCNTHTHCPVDCQWSEWSSWGTCHRQNRVIPCKLIGGIQNRTRLPQHQAYGGALCDGPQLETRVCYDIHQCYFQGNWTVWGEWSLCSNSCNDLTNSKRYRKRVCQPNLSKYPPTIGMMRDKANFHGKPNADCLPALSVSDTIEEERCLNLMPCP